MKLAVMQPYFFPYAGYWQLISAVDYFVIFDDVNFIKKGYINRNSILANGKPQLITLELFGASQNKCINEIEVGGNRKKILKTIELSYKKAPFFDKVFPLITEILTSDEKNLAKFVGCSLEKISDHLDLKTKFVYSSDIRKNNNLKAQDKILEIVSLLEATHYINAIGGQELYDKSRFSKENVGLNFLDTTVLEYQQFNNKFEPNLSIVDIMMFNGIDEIDNILSCYKLI